MAEIPELRRHARAATSAIAGGRERAEAGVELYEHALSHYEDLRSAGLDHDAAVRGTITQLGDPAEMAADFGKAHRQPLTPGAIALLALAVIVFFGSFWGLFYLLMTFQLSTFQILLAALASCLLPGSALLAITLVRRKK